MQGLSKAHRVPLLTSNLIRKKLLALVVTILFNIDVNQNCSFLREKIAVLVVTEPLIIGIQCKFVFFLHATS